MYVGGVGKVSLQRMELTIVNIDLRGNLADGAKGAGERAGAGDLF